MGWTQITDERHIAVMILRKKAFHLSDSSKLLTQHLHAAQEELRQASQTLPGAVTTDKAEMSARARSASSKLPTPLPSARVVEAQETSVAELPKATATAQIVEVMYDTPALEKQTSSASTASLSDGGKQKEAKDQAAPTEVVIAFDRRPPFVSGPFKERVKVPSIKLLPVADVKPTGKPTFSALASLHTSRQPRLLANY